MDIGAILVGISVLVLAVLYVATPLFTKRKPDTQEDEGQQNPALQLRVVIRALRDLDFDFQTGKVIEEDYRLFREQLLIKAASFIPAEDELEALLEKRRETAGNPAFCVICGNRLLAGDFFCNRCGAHISNTG